jgi:hypothetical protein
MQKNINELQAYQKTFFLMISFFIELHLSTSKLGLKFLL